MNIRTKSGASLRQAGSVPVMAAALLLSTAPALAQSTGTQQIETVVVTAAVTNRAGLLVPLEIPKERSVITQDFIRTQPSGQTVFDSLNLIPGFNFTNSDPYGNSGGNIRLHGMDGNRISLTWDGMPLNDTGNYATFTNQIVDTEIIDRVTVNQGTTDVDSPTASATGGVINILTAKPADEFAFLADLSAGTDAYKRGFVRLDTGAFGPWDTRAFATYSYTAYDKFKGPGNLLKAQVNAYVYQDLGSTGWFGIAAHFNRNRNDFYNNVSFLPVLASRLFPAVDPTFAVAAPNVALDAQGRYTGTNPAALGGFGLGFDEDPTYTRAPAVHGSAGSDPCTGFFRVRINPSDTGNIRAASLWHLTDALTFTLDADFQYVLANGGGYTNVSETDSKLRGSLTGPALTPAQIAAASVTPFGCIAGAGCDLNGDGDIRDTVGEYTPNNTNTRRYGVNAQLLYAVDGQNTVQLAYVLDWGLHRQTGQWSTFDSTFGPHDVFGGLRDPAHRVLAADGFALRQRDRKSYAILNQFSLDYEGRFFDDTLRVSAGVRLPFYERDLNQFCFNQTTGFAFCMTEAPSPQTPALAAAHLFQFAGSNGFFTAPASETVHYSRTVPNAGIAWLPFGPEHQFFATYAQGISVPRTDNLYNGGTNGDPACHTAVFPAPAPCVYTTFENSVRPETTATYDLGYRFTGDWASASLTLWNTQYRNRVVTTFDPDQGLSVDHNIGTVNMDGVDFEGSLTPLENLDLYGSASYIHSRVAPGPLSRLVPGTNPAVTVSIAGKEVVETPDWTFSGRAQYTIAGFTLGLEGKFVGRRFATDTNDYRVPSYFTAATDITYDLGEIGWNSSYLKLNVDNLLDRHYFGSVGTSKNCFTPLAASVVAGCTAYPLLSVGAPRSVTVELRSAL